MQINNCLLLWLRIPTSDYNYDYKMQMDVVYAMQYYEW